MFKRFLMIVLPFIVLSCLVGGAVTPAFAASPDRTVTPAATPFTSDSYFSPALSGGWNSFFDQNGVLSAWTQSNGSVGTAGASWSFPTTPASNCQIWVYVPVSISNATANIGYGIFTSHGRIGVPHIDQNTSPGGWVLIWTGSGVNSVQLANNDGQTTTRIAVGTTTTSLEVYCP